MFAACLVCGGLGFCSGFSGRWCSGWVFGQVVGVSYGTLGFHCLGLWGSSFVIGLGLSEFLSVAIFYSKLRSMDCIDPQVLSGSLFLFGLICVFCLLLL